MIVKNKALRLIVISSKVTLAPGVNNVELSAEELATVEGHAELEVIKPLVEDASAPGISGMTAPQAIAIINETHNEDAVRLLLEEENGGKKRASVMKAIEAKLSEIKKALAEDADSTDNKEDEEF